MHNNTYSYKAHCSGHCHFIRFPETSYILYYYVLRHHQKQHLCCLCIQQQLFHAAFFAVEFSKERKKGRKRVKEKIVIAISPKKICLFLPCNIKNMSFLSFGVTIIYNMPE